MTARRTPAAAELRGRSGAHRPHRSPLRDLVSIVAVVVVVIVVAAGAWVLTRSTASSIESSSGSADAGAEQGAGDAVPLTPATPTTSPPSATGPTSPGTETASQSPTTPPAGAVDRSVAVTVLNSTRTSGLAATVAATLRSAGWTVPTTDNYRRTSPPTTVYYGSADQRATARVVAADVGGSPQVQQSSEFGRERITVVIGSDYAG